MAAAVSTHCIAPLFLSSRERALSHSGLVIGAGGADAGRVGPVVPPNQAQATRRKRGTKAKAALAAYPPAAAADRDVGAEHDDSLFDGESLLMRRPLKGHRAPPAGLSGAGGDPLLASLSLTPIKPRLHDTTTSPSRPVNVSQSTFTHWELRVGAQTCTGPSAPQIRSQRRCSWSS